MAVDSGFVALKVSAHQAPHDNYCTTTSCFLGLEFFCCTPTDLHEQSKVMRYLVGMEGKLEMEQPNPNAESLTLLKTDTQWLLARQKHWSYKGQALVRHEHRSLPS